MHRIVAISVAGRAPKQDPAIFALAMCAGWGDAETRHLALTSGMTKVCRTASHMLQFASYIEQFRGWGRGGYGHGGGRGYGGHGSGGQTHFSHGGSGHSGH